MIKTKLCAFSTIFCTLSLANATEHTWIAEAANSNLNTANNWSPTGVPGSGDIANFNSSIEGISFDPITQTPFTVGTLNFQNSAFDI